MDTMSARVVSITEGPRAPEFRHRPGPTFSTSELRIDGWLAQPTLNALTRDEVTVRLRPQLMDLLLCLASHPGKVVLKDEILAAVWDGRWIAESAVSRCIAELRSAFGDDARQPRIIQTITKRGYRLIARVEPVSMSDDVATAPACPPALREADALPTGRDNPAATRSLWRRLACAARAMAGRFRS